jgi:Dolichyl-phosphate-mannose-protein mannosyltransferase
VSRTIGPWALAAVLCAAAAVTALDYSFHPGDNTLLARRGFHHGILNGTANAPERYRVLVPAIVEGPIRLFARVMPYDQAFDRAYAIFYFLAMVSMLWALYAYLTEWFTDEQALVGVLLVACTIRITIRQHDWAPGSYLEPGFFSIALLLILRDRRWWFAFLVAVASLSRETGVFLVLLYLATAPFNRRSLWTATMYLAVSGAVFVGVRLVLGDAERYWTLGRVLETNLSQPSLAVFNVAVFLGAVWLFAILGFARAPVFARRAAAIIPIYLGAIAVWGIWWEVRLLMPIYPLVLPLALSYLFTPRQAAPLRPYAPA